MNRYVKLGLDLLLGAVIPIVILNNLSKPLGALPAYLLAALIPVGWVFIDLVFITKRFNFITSYTGLLAVVRGLLAFWFVDGLLFAIKDTVNYVLTTLIFGGSVLVAHPIMYYFLVQHLDPRTPEQQHALDTFLLEQPIRRALLQGSGLVVLSNVFATIANFFLNLVMVKAAFGTDLFNQQVAQVNAITRIALAIPTSIGFAIAFWLMFRALYQQLPREPGKAPEESDFWELMRLRAENQAASGN